MEEIVRNLHAGITWHQISGCIPGWGWGLLGFEGSTLQGLHVWAVITPCCACAQSSKNDTTASNTLNTYLYCCKSLPRTVNEILHLPSSLKSKNSLHGLRCGGFWIATPLPATQTPPRQDITCTTSSSAPRMREQGLSCQKNQEAFSECSRKPAVSRRKRMQGLYLPLTILLLSKEG